MADPRKVRLVDIDPALPCVAVTGWIGPNNRTPLHVRVAREAPDIQTLSGKHRIAAAELRRHGVVVPGYVIIEATVRVTDLTCESAIGRHAAARVPRTAVGRVENAGDDIPSSVQRDVGAP